MSRCCCFTFFMGRTESLWFSHATLALQQGIMTWLSFATHFSEMFSVLWGSALPSSPGRRRKIKAGWSEHARGNIKFDESAALLQENSSFSYQIWFWSGGGWTLVLSQAVKTQKLKGWSCKVEGWRSLVDVQRRDCTDHGGCRTPRKKI